MFDLVLSSACEDSDIIEIEIMNPGKGIAYSIVFAAKCAFLLQISDVIVMQVLVTSFSEISEHEYLDPRTAQVAVVDHVKQVSYVSLNLTL